MKPYALIAAAAILLISCKTVPVHVDESWPEEKYFQMGQQALDKNNNSAALVYYQTYLDRFSDNQAKEREARYEIALITYKDGNKAEAETMFSDLVNEMNEDGEGPEWVLILSEKLLNKIQK